MTEKKVNVELKNGKVIKRSYTPNMKKNYRLVSRPPYKGRIYVRNVVNFGKKKDYMTQKKERRSSFSGQKRIDAKNFDTESFGRQIKDTASNMRYKLAYVKAIVRIKTKEGDIFNINVVSEAYARLRLNDMISDFSAKFKRRMDELDISPGLEGNTDKITLTKLSFVTVPSGNGI